MDERYKRNDTNEDDGSGEYNPRNPDYNRSPFMQKASDDIILGALREGTLFKNATPVDEKVYVMAANGAPTTYLREKPQHKQSKPGPDLEKDLAEGVSSLNISESQKSDEANAKSGDGKSYKDWKDELPIHLKSLQFMIGVLNDRHKNPLEFASSSLLDIPPPIFGDNAKNLEVMHDAISDSPFPFPGDRIYPPSNPNEYILTERPRPLKATFTSKRSNPRGEFRRRARSADHDLFLYREPLAPFHVQKRHMGVSHSDSLDLTGCSYNKRRSIDQFGSLVVEDIHEDDYQSAGETDSVKSVSPIRISNPVRRDFGNISPISEDMTESDKEEDENGMETEITPGDISIISRLNCSSPILSHSPSLRKTPILSNLMQETPPSSGGQKKVRNITRALDDISDCEEEEKAAAKTSSSDSEEENTESFEIDLAAAGDGMDCLSVRSPSDVTKGEKENLRSYNNGGGDGDFENFESFSGAGAKDEKEKRTQTVWETLCANIEAHIGDGNPAGFISGPIDHPIEVSSSPEPEESPSYVCYEKPSMESSSKMPFTF